MGNYIETSDEGTHYFLGLIDDYYTMHGDGADFITIGYTEIIFTPANLDVGELSLTLSLTDGTYMAAENITIIIHNVNDAPTAPTLNKPFGETGGDTNHTAIPFENASRMVNLTGSGGDDVDLLVSDEVLYHTIDWGDGSLIEVVSPDETDTFVLRHTYYSEGEYYINFSVSDTGVLTAWDGYWIIVTAGIPPPPPMHEPIFIEYVLVIKDISDMDPQDIIDDPTGFMDMNPEDKGDAFGSYIDDGYGDEEFRVWIRFYDKDGAEISRNGGAQWDGSFDIHFLIPKGTHSYDMVYQEGNGPETRVPNHMKTSWSRLIPEPDPPEPPPPDYTGYYIMAAAFIVIIVAAALVLWSRPNRGEEGGDPWTQQYRAQATQPSAIPTPRPLVIEPEFEGISGRGRTFRPRIDEERPAMNGDAGPWEDQTTSGDFVDDDWEGLREEREEEVAKRPALIMDVEALPAATTPHPKKANGRDRRMMDEDEEDQWLG